MEPHGEPASGAAMGAPPARPASSLLITMPGEALGVAGVMSIAESLPSIG